MSSSLPSQVSEYLSRSKHTGTRVVPLTGDASDRRYFRVLRTEPSHDQTITPVTTSFVLAVHTEPFDPATLPFLNVAELLASMPVPVPRVLDVAGDLGVIALEDLGDVTLQAHVGAGRTEAHAALYRQAVAYINVIQRRGAELKSTRYTPYGIAFDEEKLTWESDFFIKHFLEGYRGIFFTPSERDALRAESAKIIRELAAEPRVLCHRDYHSRNLMFRFDALWIIDFQDARMGPDTYDLVSLLRDSYVDLADGTVDDLIAYFLALQGRAADEASFRRRFDLMALQRNLKALGTFGYQTTVRRNTVYIQYMPRTLRYARETLHKYTRFARLAEILAVHVAEFQ